VILGPNGQPMRGVQREHLGTDPVGGNEWRKTANTVKVAQALHDCMVTSGMTGAELFGALTENLIAAIQGSAAPSQWQELGDATCTVIMRRMQVR
jgi:hypothetical protein